MINILNFFNNLLSRPYHTISSLFIPSDTFIRFYYLSLINEGNNEWSIHGLWPQYTPTSYPTYCGKVSFDISKLELILPELNQYWYSEDKTETKNADFWKHEYLKHGSCVFTPLNELEYFGKTLKLYKSAVDQNIPINHFNKKTNKCLIPVDLNFKFYIQNTNIDLIVV
jgi:ribonuclease I